MKVLQTMTALSLAALLAMPAFAKDLATINGKGFTEEQYRQGMERFGVNPDMVKSNPEIRQQLMDHLVNSQLLADAAGFVYYITVTGVTGARDRLPDDLAAIEQLVHVNRVQLLHRLGAPEEALARFLPAEPG